MSDYRRIYYPNGLYFFTVVTARRRPVFGDPRALGVLRDGFRYVMTQRRFKLEAIVVLPDHLHCLWQLPEGDSDFSNRWKMLKGYVTRHLREVKGPVWQARFWEHLIRDEDDQQRHLDYIHFNPVKHGLVNDPAEWSASSFKRYLDRGDYPHGWGLIAPPGIATLNYE